AAAGIGRRAPVQGGHRVPGAALAVRQRAPVEPHRALARGPSPQVLPHHRARTRGPRRLAHHLATDAQLRRPLHVGRKSVMNRSAPRSIDAYLKQLRGELADADPALMQDALYDAEEY